MKNKRLFTSLLLLTLLFSMVPPQPVRAEAGDLDSTFGGGDGMASADFSLGEEQDRRWDYGYATAVQPDGKIIVAGWVTDSYQELKGGGVARFNTDGSLDTGFGSGNGKQNFLGIAHAVALQPDGRIVVAGDAHEDFHVAIYNQDGEMGSTGWADFGNYDRARAIAIKSSGEIVIGGWTYTDQGSDFALAFYSEIDPINILKVTTDFDGGNDEVNAMAIQPDGKIVVAGSATVDGSVDFALARYSASGVLDSGFGEGGKVTTDFTGNEDKGHALAIQADGKILVAGVSMVPGEHSGQFALARYDSAGDLDTSFGTDGMVTTNFTSGIDSGWGMALQSDEKIVVAGCSNEGSNHADFALARYHPDGELDNDLGIGGRVVTDFTDSPDPWVKTPDCARAVTLYDDKIIAAGYADLYANISFDFAVVRYDNDAYPATATVTVDTTSDVSDGDTSSISALITNKGADGKISLREAIIAANKTPSRDTIRFNIPGDWVQTIQPTSNLPALTGNGGTTIDGYTQPGSTPATADAPANLKIEIDGSQAGANHGFLIVSPGNTIRGLIINRFQLNGISIQLGTGNLISGNYIGTNATGTSDLGNGNHGVYIQTQDNAVGGDEPAERNLISGNDLSGVGLSIVGTSDNVVSGNYIGTDASGTTALGNLYGVNIANNASANTIGGNSDGEGNLISGNTIGIEIKDGASDNLVTGNYIGVDTNGANPLQNGAGVRFYNSGGGNVVGGDTLGERNLIAGNLGSGVLIHNSSDNTVTGNLIGLAADGATSLGNGSQGVMIRTGSAGNTIGPDNTIANNSLNGVEVSGVDSVSNTITQNSIYANTGLGIALEDGGNNNITAPAIDTVASGSIQISGTACTGCTVEVFASPDNDGEGQVYLGSDVAEGGNFAIEVSSLPYLYLTATATDPTDGTSEFSQAFTATLPTLTTSSKTVDASTVLPGGILKYTLTLLNTGAVAAEATLTDTLSSDLTWLDQYTVSTGTLSWDATNNRLLWEGSVDLGGGGTITYQAKVNTNVPIGRVIANTATVDDGYGSTTELGPANTTVFAYQIQLPLVAR